MLSISQNMIGILALVSFVVTIEKYNFTYKVWGGGGGGVDLQNSFYHAQ
jgi:hypothetical protein